MLKLKDVNINANVEMLMASSDREMRRLGWTLVIGQVFSISEWKALKAYVYHKFNLNKYEKKEFRRIYVSLEVGKKSRKLVKSLKEQRRKDAYNRTPRKNSRITEIRTTRVVSFGPDSVC